MLQPCFVEEVVRVVKAGRRRGEGACGSGLAVPKVVGAVKALAAPKALACRAEGAYQAI